MFSDNYRQGEKKGNGKTGAEDLDKPTVMPCLVEDELQKEAETNNF